MHDIECFVHHGLTSGINPLVCRRRFSSMFLNDLRGLSVNRTLSLGACRSASREYAYVQVQWHCTCRLLSLLSCHDH